MCNSHLLLFNRKLLIKHLGKLAADDTLKKVMNAKDIASLKLPVSVEEDDDYEDEEEDE